MIGDDFDENFWRQIFIAAVCAAVFTIIMIKYIKENGG